ncbi:MAG: MmcQ/YjbR family DNA-binding protein [Marinobacterium sp.]|nr:MmcQ/YjbR family DNA-binding protein [Marinobacterium sp.]
MKRSALETLLLSQPHAQESYPFGEQWQVFKAKGKIFAIVAEREKRLSVNLKCDPIEAQMLRDIFPEVTAGYHMNKRHWNTVHLDGELPPGEIARMVEHSWQQVIRKLKKTDRQQLTLLTARRKDQL